MPVATTNLDADLFSPNAFDHLARVDLPLAGLGLPLASPWSHAKYHAAIQAVTLPPSVKVGIRFPKLPGGGALNFLFSHFETWRNGYTVYPGAPSPTDPALGGLSKMMLVPLLPIVALPGAWGHVVAAEHFVLLLRRLALGDIDVAALPAYWKSTPPYRCLLHYRRPIGRGRVTHDHMLAFASSFPNLASALLQCSFWRGARSVSAAIANHTVHRLIGIEVDVRVGTLVSPEEVDMAIEKAVGYRYTSIGDRLIDPINDLMDARLKIVGARQIGRKLKNIRGAAWSCEVDRLLSLPEACPN